jgi:site-specific recombinase XerD
VPIFVHDAIEEYLATKQNRLTKSTYDWYARFLGWFDDWTTAHRLTELGKINASHVQQFVSDAPPNSSSHTKHARAQIVKGFLSWCAKDPEFGVREAVVKRIEMPKVVQSEVELLDDHDISRLLRACKQTMHPHRNIAIIHLLLDTGVRAAELCYDADRPGEETGLRMENLILGRSGESFIRVMGKGRKVRTVGLGDETTLAVRRYLTRERIDTGIKNSYVLLSRDGDPLSVRMLQQFLSELGESAGVPYCHAHRFRHTFAVNQLLAGTSDLVLMRLMGHTTLESTKIYVRAMTQIQARNAAVSVVDQMRRRQR